MIAYDYLLNNGQGSLSKEQKDNLIETGSLGRLSTELMVDEAVNKSYLRMQIANEIFNMPIGTPLTFIDTRVQEWNENSEHLPKDKW